jgi:hypothetical protein
VFRSPPTIVSAPFVTVFARPSRRTSCNRAQHWARAESPPEAARRGGMPGEADASRCRTSACARTSVRAPPIRRRLCRRYRYTSGPTGDSDSSGARALRCAESRCGVRHTYVRAALTSANDGLQGRGRAGAADAFATVRRDRLR